MPDSIFLEVEENDNCDYMPLQVYESHQASVPISKVNLADSERPHGTYQVTGWSSHGNGTPCPALYTPVSDSGQAVVHLVYGGDWGIRLKPMDPDEEWDINSLNQWGEPYLMLTDQGAIILEV